MSQSSIIYSVSASGHNAPCRLSPLSPGSRKRTQSFRRWTLAKAATTLVISISPATAFQAAPLHLSSRARSLSPPIPKLGPRRTSDTTRHWTMTDPDMLLIETSRARRRSPKEEAILSESIESLESLENMYITSQRMGELSVGQRGDAAAPAWRNPRRSSEPAFGQVTSLPARQKKLASKSPRKPRARHDVQLSSLESTNKPSTPDRKQVVDQNSKKPVQFKSVSKSSRKRDSKTSKATATASKDGDKKTAPRSRSSTMPGFSTRHLTGRQKAFNDSIKLAEKRTGKNLSKIVNSKEARQKRKKANGEAMYKASASVPDSLVQFASEIHNVDRITPKEEVELGTMTQEAIRLQGLYENLENKLDRQPTDDEWCAAAGKINMEAIRQAIEDGSEAKNRLVTSNLRMVQGVVNIYIRNGLGGQYNAGDMMQEGILALMRAAEKFEPERGFRFSTYAMYWIRAAVKRSHIFQSRVVNVPQRLHENHKRVLRVEKELRITLSREPTKKELAEASGMSEQQLERCMTAMAQRCYSLDAELTNKLQPNNGDTGGKNTLYELIDSRTDDGEYDNLQRLFMREDLIETLYRHLTPHEADLLLLRFGLMDERTAPHGFAGPLTIAEVSGLVGLKPDKVRRMINSSLKQLKYLIANEWNDFERELE